MIDNGHVIQPKSSVCVMRQGPKGRRGDKVGGYYLTVREDMRKIAPLWLEYTARVRYDPDVRSD